MSWNSILALHFLIFLGYIIITRELSHNSEFENSNEINVLPMKECMKAGSRMFMKVQQKCGKYSSDMIQLIKITSFI